MIKSLFFSFVGLALLIGGVATFDYSRPDSSRVGHAEWAERENMPAPSDGMMWSAAAGAAIGLVLLVATFRPKRAVTAE